MLTRCTAVVVIEPAARRTVSTTPPGMAMAAASVGGSPMASTVYGAASATPSRVIAPPAPLNED